MSRMNTVEQGRAAFALKRVKEALQKHDNKTFPKEYKSYSKKLPMLIKTNGLAATFAFMNTKEDATAYIVIGSDIVSWLKTNDETIRNLQSDLTDLKLSSFLNYLLNLQSDSYRVVTNEVLSFMNWHRRFTEGLVKDTDGKK